MTSSDAGHSLQMVELKTLLQRKQVTVSVAKPRLQLAYPTHPHFPRRAKLPTHTSLWVNQCRLQAQLLAKKLNEESNCYMLGVTQEQLSEASN